MASSAMQQPLPFPEGFTPRPAACGTTFPQRRVVAPGADPYRGLHLVHSVPRSQTTQARANAIVAEVEHQLGAAGNYGPHTGATFFPAHHAMDTPLVAMRRILQSLRSLSRIA